MQKKVLLIVANEGFQATEYFETKKVLESAGFKVFTASDRPENIKTDRFQATAHDGSVVEVDMPLEAVFVDDYDAIFVIGGPKALEHLDNYEVYRIVQDANAVEDVVFGGICIAPRILANAGVLNGRKATGWDGDGELQHVFDESETLYVKTHVVVDRNLITAIGPSAAKEFGEAIVQTLQQTLI